MQDQLTALPPTSRITARVSVQMDALVLRQRDAGLTRTITNERAIRQR